MSLKKSRIASTITACLMVFVIPLLVNQPAQAAAGDLSYVLNGTNVRVCGSTDLVWCGSSWNGIRGTVVGSQWDQTWCWRDGGWALGTNRWFKVTALTDVGWRTGWVIAAQVPVQATVPWCSSWQ